MPAAFQSSWFKSHWPYLLGAAFLHLLIAGLFGLTMISMQRNAPPPTLAIQAVIVDQNQLAAQPVRKPQQDRERARRDAEAKAAEQRKAEEDAAAKREQELKAEQERQETQKRQEQEQEQEKVREAQVVRERETQERVAKEKAAEQQREVERKQKAEGEQQAKAEAERKRVAEIERKQREREEAERRQAKADADVREKQLQDQLAEEEGLMQARASGAMNQYAAMIQQHVERQWNRPPSARSGIECEVSVAQSPTGTVLRVQVGRCNGDQAVKQSIENAVQRASPLPLPTDMRLFDRNLRFIFKPGD
jgi:colicin import membrane protein